MLIYISTFCINLSILFLNFFIKLFSVYFYVFRILTFFLFISILGKRKTSNVVYHIMFYHITSLYILNIQFLILCCSHQRLYYHIILICNCQYIFIGNFYVIFSSFSLKIQICLFFLLMNNILHLHMLLNCILKYQRLHFHLYIFRLHLFLVHLQ